VLSGRAGTTSTFHRNPGTTRELSLGNTDIMPCEPDDIVRVVGAGAGGYGDPFTRDPDAVAADVRRGFVSSAAARERYGVILCECVVDRPATQALRAARSPLPSRHFDVGEARRTFEELWSEARYAELTRFLAGQPLNWRHHLKRRFFAAVAAEAAETDLVAQMERIGIALLARRSDR
jgi:N-methylhydantoinase B